MIVSNGEKLHVCVRRMLDDETRRHYVGEVAEAAGAVVRLKAWMFIFDNTRNEFVRKPELRTTIMDLGESGYTVSVIPANVDLGELRYAINRDRRLVVTDGEAFSLDINEFGPRR